MAEQTFKSPGFFEREIEIISRPDPQKQKVSAALIGPTMRGPAFVPTYVSSYDEYVRLFGNPDRNRLVGHAASEYFKNNGDGALTICRVLGAGSNVDSISDFSNFGTVPGAGFQVKGRAETRLGGVVADSKFKGSIHFIAGEHTVAEAEHLTLGFFNDNDSFSTDMDDNDNPSDGFGSVDKTVELIRAMLVVHKDYTVKIGLRSSTVDSDAAYTNDFVSASSNEFKIEFRDTENVKSKILLVSLDPESSNYIEKVLNTDPLQLDTQYHYLYAHFPVDKAVAELDNNLVCVLTGTGSNYNEYGKFNTRYQAPKTTKFISQPYGNKEYDLFHFESLDDGAYASGRYKISIADLKASDDPNDKFGSFTVLVRDLRDTDEAPVVFRSFPNCNLNPRSASFIGRVIGDKKVYLNLDVATDEEKRLVVDGTFENQNEYIRVVLSDAVLNEEVPQDALPFGFRGIPTLKTTENGLDHGRDSDSASMLLGSNVKNELKKSQLPPLPYRFKVTKGLMTDTNDAWSQTFLGEASNRESVNGSLYWGVMSSRVTSPENPNKLSTDGLLFNKILENYSKFLGNEKSSIFHTGSLADTFNNHKFSLGQVAFGNGSSVSSLSSLTISEAFKDAVYIRNGGVGGNLWQTSDQTILLGNTSGKESDDFNVDKTTARVTYAKILSENVRLFNKFSPMAKFTNIMYGGFDGVNIFDKDSYYMTDRAASIEEATVVDTVGGKAKVDGFASGLFGTNEPGSIMQGTLLQNNIVNSYNNAIRVMTEEMFINHNMMSIPGMKESLITDYAARRIEDYGLSFLVMDIPYYDQDNNRLFTDAGGSSSGIPDAEVTSNKFDNREVNSSYVATYFPDVLLDDAGDDDEGATTSRRRIKVPASVAAFGALAISSLRPWFAPAGFQRGALTRVRATDVRLNSGDRDTLYEARINPIASFPNNQFVIFGQKTTQISRTALDRVNVRRLMINIKRKIGLIAQGLLFAQNDQATRTRFIDRATEELASIQIGQGIEDFRVIMDDTNNTADDVDNNRLNGKIIIVPTRAVEFIAIDFIITNSGVEFPS